MDRIARGRRLLHDLVATEHRASPELRHLQSVLVAREGEVQFEQYFRDRRPTDLSNVHSVTKSVVATLAGIAISRGALTLETTLGEIFEEIDDERKRGISIEHLLAMTAGLEAGTPYDIDEIADRGESWVAGPLAAPLRAEPGTTFIYNNGAAHVLGVVIARAAGTPLATYAEEHLFTPLGIHDYRWPTDPDGNPLGYGHLELRPRDLVRLGQLYLDGGRSGSTRVLPELFVAAATSPHSAGGPPEQVPYGYLWWVTEDGGRRSFFAGGYGGQYVTVIPELAIIVVTTGDAAVLSRNSGNPRGLVRDVIFQALESS
jgi:CubicO group peptidase (beta-lactamase class C family)